MIPAIQIGQLSISTYWLMMFFGAILMLALMQLRKGRFGISTVQAVVFTVLLTMCGLLGTKLLFIVENFDEVRTNGLTFGGLSFYGAVFLVPILMPVFCRLFSMSHEQMNDATSLCGLAILGVLRFGCFLNGCCGGTETAIGELTFQWPTQAIESIGDFCILVILYNLEKRGRYTGQMYPLFLICYSVLRFTVEFFRDTPKTLLLLSRGQWYAVVAIIIGTIWFICVDRRKRA